MSNSNDVYIDITGQNVSEQGPNYVGDNYNCNLYDNSTMQRKQTSDTLFTTRDDLISNLDMNDRNTNNALSESNTLSDPTAFVEGGESKPKLYEKLLRTREQARVTNIELFFDLVFVYASMSTKRKSERGKAWHGLELIFFLLSSQCHL